MNRTITQLVILARTFADELEAILQSTAAVETTTAEAPASAPKRRGRPATTATAVAEPAQQATAEPTQSAEKAEGKSLDELKALIAPAVQAGVGAEVKKLIAKHGGSQLADLPPENHAAFAKDVEGLVY